MLTVALVGCIGTSDSESETETTAESAAKAPTTETAASSETTAATETTTETTTGHSYVNDICEYCGQRKPSEGLDYTINDDGASYSVTGIGSCSDTDIVIPAEYNGKPVIGIGNWAFYSCLGLTKIEIPDSVTSIGDFAFVVCIDLTSITIGNGVTSIGEEAFNGCSSLTSITIPDSVTSIGERAFYGCSGLTSITVAEDNPVYHSEGNCLINTRIKILIRGCNSSIIPADGSVTSIGSSAFEDCTGLTSITIPDGVTSIGAGAFWSCAGLTSITISASVTGIGSYAFYNCSGLTDITFTGTKAQWNAISKGDGWDNNTGSYVIHCTDGDIAKSDS